MKQTIARNILINSKANDRRTNYGQHPFTCFNDLDTAINDNTTYNNILNKLDKLESIYNNNLEELDILISNARQTNYKLLQEKELLDLIDTYTYTVPNSAPFISFINTINRLIGECNAILINILNNSINSINIYSTEIILNEISSSIYALVSKEWLSNYINTIPTIPKATKINATLVCDSGGNIVWQ